MKIPVNSLLYNTRKKERKIEVFFSLFFSLFSLQKARNRYSVFAYYLSNGLFVITKKATQDPNSQKHIQKLIDSLALPSKDLALYILAFIHRSIVNERSDFAPEHNERLEFLGDAILELAITDSLFRNFPEKQEGELTDLRSAIVRGRNLAEVAKKLHFDEYLFL